MGNYWGEPERAPPSGVAGWMFCLFVCTYCTLCCKSLAALIEHTLASCVQSKWFTRSEDMDPEQPTSSMALFLVLLPDSQFLCWNSLSKGASACWKIRRKCFICPCHLVVSYIISHVSCRAHDVLPVCSTSIQTVCDVPAGLLHWAIPWLTVPLLCMCLYFWCVIFYGLKSQSHSDDSHVHALLHLFCTCTRSGSPHNVMHSSSCYCEYTDKL